MKLIWNGTGSAWSTAFGNSSAVLECRGRRLLLDCGHTAPGRLKRMGLSLQDIDAGFISHLHGDHVYGLEEWGFRNYLIWKTRPPLFIASDLIEPLWNRVLAGTMSQLKKGGCRLEDFFEVIPMEVGKPLQVYGWELEIHPVRHVPYASSYGVRVLADGVRVGFTCDTLADCDPWFYEGSEAVFHDCTFKPYSPSTVHAHFEQLCGYPRAFREKTWLVHFDDDVETDRQDQEWKSRLCHSQLRLTEPYQEFVFGDGCTRR